MKTILFADNDPDFLAVRSEFLTAAGYNVLLAHSPDQARQILDSKCVQLAILDVRLTDDNNTDDISGLELARDPTYRTLPKIMLTRFPETDGALLAVRPDWVTGAEAAAVDYIAKKDGPTALIESVEAVFEHRVRMNEALIIRWRGDGVLNLAHLVALLAPNCPPPTCACELEVLLRRLFFTCRQITIGRLLWRRPGRLALEVINFAANREEPLLLILGAAGQLEKDLDAFRSMAPRPGAGNQLQLGTQLASQRFAAQTWHLPALPLEKAISLETAIQTDRSREIRRGLETLADNALANWGARVWPAADGTELVPLLLDKLNLAERDLTTKLDALAQQTANAQLLAFSFDASSLEMILPNGRRLTLVNPLPLVTEGGWGPAGPAMLANLPDNLAPDTLFLAGDGATWLADPTNVASVPVWLPYLSLEAGARFGVLAADNVLTLVHFERQLAASTSLQGAINATDVEAAYRPTLTAIQAIRRAAAQAIVDDPLAYRSGLLCLALAHLGQFDPQLAYTSRELLRFLQPLLAAAFLAGAVQNPSPAAPESSDPSPLRVDLSNRQVWVNGVEKQLTQTEFDLLAYLYQRAGQLCSRRDLLRDVFRADALEPRAQKSLLNTNIGRLRKKIETNPAEPRFIITVQGQGYRLKIPAVS